MNILGVDPSVNHVGIALYSTEEKKLRTWIFHPARDKETTIVQVGNQIIKFLCLNVFIQNKPPAYIVMEYPQFENSQRGWIAAQQGFTLDLAFIIGFIAGWQRLSSSYVFTPTPMEWKKNLPKDAIGARFEKRFLVSAKSLSNHEFEAAMMIDWLLKSGQIID